MLTQDAPRRYAIVAAEPAHELLCELQNIFVPSDAEVLADKLDAFDCVSVVLGLLKKNWAKQLVANILELLQKRDMRRPAYGRGRSQQVSSENSVLRRRNCVFASHQEAAQRKPRNADERPKLPRKELLCQSDTLSANRRENRPRDPADVLVTRSVLIVTHVDHGVQPMQGSIR
jgi:hypothetical protein